MAELLVERDGATTILTINRPERRNALSRSLLAELEAAVAEFAADPGRSAAIITGAGDRAFSAGADLREMADAVDSGAWLPVPRRPDIAGIAACEKPVIAAVNGLAVAGGLELALCCDIRLATPDAWFAAFEVKRGIVAGVAATLLPRLVPHGVASDVLLAGARLDAERAYQVGLVQEVVERPRLLERALGRAAAVAAHSPSAVRGTKRIMSFWRDLAIAEQQHYAEAVIHRVLLSGDVLEGPRAFAEHRDPVFRPGWPTVDDLGGARDPRAGGPVPRSPRPDSGEPDGVSG